MWRCFSDRNSDRNFWRIYGHLLLLNSLNFQMTRCLQVLKKQMTVDMMTFFSLSSRLPIGPTSTCCLDCRTFWKIWAIPLKRKTKLTRGLNQYSLTHFLHDAKRLQRKVICFILGLISSKEINLQVLLSTVSNEDNECLLLLKTWDER